MGRGRREGLFFEVRGGLCGCVFGTVHSASGERERVRESESVSEGLEKMRVFAMYSEGVYDTST